ncbi:MAG: alpha-amylase [Kineosporiaceae bacterium]|nr:alpha-amylase [Aeromicrobium sp.]
MSAEAEPMTTPGHEKWWRDAVIYQIYPRSWADSDGDGIGDLPGITARLDHLSSLGVDAVWLSPFYRSPQNDAGYDISDHRDVDPVFGNLADADQLLDTAHGLGLRVIVDLVPNHSSDQHPWFQAALTSAPGSPERARYLFRDGRGESGELPPNNWPSNFGGSAWTRVTDNDGKPGQWYLHLFDVTQPDFDWTNAEVEDQMESVLRFWLDRGVDGFRIDVAHGLVKAEGLPDAPDDHNAACDDTSLQPMWDQPGVHEIYRRWRVIVDEYSAKAEGPDGDRILCAEAWVSPAQALARYVRADELHQSFNFGFLMTAWLAPALRRIISESLAAVEAVGAPQTWVLSNHDVIRHATRLAYPQVDGDSPSGGIGIDDPQPDAALGLRRARAATTVMLALPGSAYLFQGEELGLPEATRLPDDSRQDPTWERSGHTIRGRDGCRVPVPWSGDSQSYGFGPSEASWLPQPEEWASLSVNRQEAVPESTLELYRTLLHERRGLRLGRGSLRWLEDYPADVLAFTVSTLDGTTILILANLGTTAITLPKGAQVIVASDELFGDDEVPGDVTVWARLGAL